MEITLRNCRPRERGEGEWAGERPEWVCRRKAGTTGMEVEGGRLGGRVGGAAVVGGKVTGACVVWTMGTGTGKKSLARSSSLGVL